MVGETVTFHWQLPRALSLAALSWVPHLRPPPPANKVLSLHGSLTAWVRGVGMQAGSISLHQFK